MILKYIPAINSLMIQEPHKYDMNETFDKTKFKTDISVTDKINATMTTDSFQVYSSNSIAPLSDIKLAEMVKRYNLADKSGVGLVFIAESLDKPNALGTFHAVFFLMPDGNIIMNQKYSGKAMGFGMRNFWASSFYRILKDSPIVPLKAKYLK
jgi:hypothetical protein